MNVPVHPLEDTNIAFAEVSQRLAVAESIVSAIRENRVDAFVVDGAGGPKVRALGDHDLPFRTLLDQLQQGVALLDPQGGLLYLNAALCRLLHQDLSTDRAFTEFVAVEHQALFSTLLAPETKEATIRLRYANGSASPVQVTVCPVPGEEPAACYCLIVHGLFTYSEQAAAESAIQEGEPIRTPAEEFTLQLQDSEERFRLMADSAPSFIWVTGITGREFVNASFAEFLGASRPWLTEYGWSGFIHPDDVEYYEQTYRLAFAKRQKFSLQFRLRRPSGEYRWMQTSATPRYSAVGEFLGYVGSKIDIHDMIVAQEERRVAQKQLQTVTSKMTAAVFHCGTDVHYRWVSPGFCLWIGRPMEEVVGQHATDIMGEEAWEVCKPYVAQVLSGRHVEYETLVNYRVRGERWIHATYTPTTDTNGRVDGFVGVVMDITARKDLEAKLREANELLEDRVAARTVQLRNLALELCQTEQRERKRLAHELHDNLQQLLVAIKINASLVQSRETSTRSLKDIVDLTDEAIGACRSLVMGLSPPIVRDSDLPEALAWLAETMKFQHDFDVVLHVECLDTPLSEEFRSLLFDVSRELLFNVVKHAGVFSAELKCHYNEDAVCVEVEDKGRGCDLELLEGKRKDSFGLYAIRERLATVGGRMETWSAPGIGTRVCVSVPVLDPSQLIRVPFTGELADADHTGKKRPLRLIVVDDHQIFRQSLTLVLSSEPDMQVVGEASDGQEAIELARSVPADAIIMDVTMPTVSGVEATRILHDELPGLHIVGLSTLDSNDAVNAMLQAGAAAYVNKHEPAEVLIALLRSLASE